MRALSTACVLTALWAAPALSFVYHTTVELSPESPSESFNEGIVFASHKAPFGDGVSVVTVDARVRLDRATVTRMNDNGGATLTLVALSEFSSGEVGAKNAGVDEMMQGLESDFCCTEELFLKGQCSGAVPGQPILRPPKAGANKYVAKTVALNGSVPAPDEWAHHTASASLEVERKGIYYLLVSYCGNEMEKMPGVEVESTFSFQNPYGFLASEFYGYLPFFGVLFVANLLLILAYSGALIYQREHRIPLHLPVFVVLFLSLLEALTFFGTYAQRNTTGIPLCCPVTADMWAATMISVLKQASARALVLAVSLGFGVVRLMLPVRHTLIIAFLTVSFAAFTYRLEISLLSHPERGADTNSSVGLVLPVVILDTTILMSIYYSIKHTREELARAGEATKKEMFDRLWWVLTLAAVSAAIIIIVFSILLGGGQDLTPYEEAARSDTKWLPVSFGKAITFVVLATISILWWPGPETERYSAYQEGIPAVEPDSEEDSDLEAGSAPEPAGAGDEDLAPAADGAVAASAFAIADDDEAASDDADFEVEWPEEEEEAEEGRGKAV